MLADVFAKPVVTLESQEGSALRGGAAGDGGDGEYADGAGGLRGDDPGGGRDASRGRRKRHVYAKGHRAYQALYPALKLTGFW